MRRNKQDGLKREMTRDKILTAATALFAEKGLAATSAKDIAQRAGLSVGLMYHYYKTKEDVFGALVKWAFEDVNELKIMLSKIECPKTAFLVLAGQVVAGLELGYEFARGMVMLSQPLPAKHDTKWADDFVNCHNMLADEIAVLIKNGQRLKMFKDGDPIMLSQYFMATIIGLCTLQLSQKEKFMPPDIKTLTAFIIVY